MKKSIKKVALFLSAAIIAGSAVATYAWGTEKDADKAKSPEIVNQTEETVKELTKDETVYVIAGSDGTVKKIIVSDWIKNAVSQKQFDDKTELKNIENVKGDETYTIGGDNMTVWDAEGNDIYYRGNIEKELPVGLTVSYKLNGADISAKELAGKSGKVTIRFDYENHQYETVEIDGKQQKIYVPFAMLTGMLLDNDTFSNAEVSGGKLVNDGDRTAVIGIAFPGLSENLGIDKEKLDIPDYVEITADVTDFSLGMTVTVATNEIFNNIDTSKISDFDSLTDSVNELTDGMNKLLDGSSALYDGLCTLLDKSAELADGITKLADGAAALKDATESLDKGADSLRDGTSDLYSGLYELKSNSDALNSGAEQVFETLLSTAQAQLTAKGIDVPNMTIYNYAAVLDEVIASLDENVVYKKALAQVTAAVEAKRPMIEQAVTAAVREQVAAQVIPVATNGAMTKETYDAAVAAGVLPAETVAAIEGAIDAQMQSANVKAMISEQVELQVKNAISTNMASPEVQEKLQAASEGAKAVIALKASLDSYNSFYSGLLAYTDGVDTAAGGAGKLYGGATELKNGTAQLKEGAAALYDGILHIKDGVPALTDGVTKLKDGAMQLSDGLEKLNEEGIKKIASLSEGEIKDIIVRMKATVDVSKDYRNFSGIADGTEGKVKFIYRTEEIG